MIFNKNDFLTYLTETLCNELPQESAHNKMLPNDGKHFAMFNNNVPAKESAVLILLYIYYGAPHVIMIERQINGSPHSGQIAFPGGRFEDYDINLVNTALREANEEINVNIDDVAVLGKLTKLYVPPSNFNITPIVGFINYKPVFTPAKQEVKTVFQFQITPFYNKKNIVTKNITTNFGLNINVLGYQIENNFIWGATAMILCEFLEATEHLFLN